LKYLIKISILIKIIITLYKSKIWYKFGAPKIENFKKKLGLKSNQINKYEDQIEIHTII